jgi:hypothetical protein
MELSSTLKNSVKMVVVIHAFYLRSASWENFPVFLKRCGFSHVWHPLVIAVTAYTWLVALLFCPWHF